MTIKARATELTFQTRLSILTLALLTGILGCLLGYTLARDIHAQASAVTAPAPVADASS